MFYQPDSQTCYFDLKINWIGMAKPLPGRPWFTRPAVVGTDRVFGISMISQEMMAMYHIQWLVLLDNDIL